jgi:3-hydroxymyristoyl/3-hydroxydecanoyl-(acyl carrier protein) dehydratase
VSNFLANQSAAHGLSGLPKLVAVIQNDGEMVFEIYISPDLPCFAGHFPEFAILPGVLQIDWVMQLVMAHWPDLGHFSGMDILRFARPILPGQRVMLKIQRDVQRINFAWLLMENMDKSNSINTALAETQSPQIQCSSGRIRFVVA